MKFLLVRLGAIAFFTVAIGDRALPSEKDVSEILQQVESTTNQEVIRAAMEQLADIDGARSAEAFVSIFEEKVIPLELQMTPYLALMYRFHELRGSKSDFITFLKALEDGAELAASDKVRVVGLLARFGEPDLVSWLISEYQAASQNSTDLVYPAGLLEALSKANVPEASDFVVSHVLRSGDPTIKLVAVNNMREVGNPRAIDIMRRWPSVASGDFDLVIAEVYLRTIVDFGDKRDQEFLDWLDKNAETHFLATDIETQITPLLNEARDSIDLRSNRLHDSVMGWPKVIAFAIGGFLLGLLVLLTYKRHGRLLSR